MGDTAPHLMICTCEKTMQLDARAIGRACSGTDYPGQPALRVRNRPVQGGTRRWRTHYRRLYPGSPLVPGSGGRSRPLLSAHLRQHSRNRGMVEGCGRGWPKGRSADRGCRRGYAAHRASDAREPRRRPDLWPRRGSDRGRSPTRRPSRHHGASDQAWRRDSSPLKRVSGPEGQRAQCSWASRPV